MGKINAIHRYSLIIQIISDFPYISLKQLLDEVNDELDKFGDTETGRSDRTLKRDLNDLRNELNIPIEYSHIEKGYYFPKDQDWKNEDIIHLQESLDLLNVMNAKTGLNEIVFPEQRNYRGTKYMVTLIKAIKAGSPICFKYQKYGESQSTKRKAYPYAIKESRDRWYLLCMEVGQDYLKSFGLDRLSQLEILPGKFRKDTTIDIKDRFHDLFGIVEREEFPVEDIILSFSHRDGEYLKSLPIHHSQKVISENPDKDEIRISLHVKITEDLILEILSRGTSLKVIQPPCLAEEICNIYRESLDRYPSTKS